MGFYNVVSPCVVGKLHYARPTVQPIEVDDDTAASLVDEGSLVPYGPQRVSGEERQECIEAFFGDEPTESTYVDGGEVVTVACEVPDDEAEPKPRRSRRRGDSSGSAD